MGNKLFSEVTNLTGLPEDLIGPELKQLLTSKGVTPEQLTMESLREALANYLTEIHESMNAESSEASVPKSKTGLPTQ